MKKINKNYLDMIPARAEEIKFTTDEANLVTLEIENKGVFNRIFQVILKKPKISFIHLDDLGSFIWCHIDGESTVFEISEKVKEKFGDNAEPLYERIVKFMEILKDNKLIRLSV